MYPIDEKPKWRVIFGNNQYEEFSRFEDAVGFSSVHSGRIQEITNPKEKNYVEGT